MSSRLPVSSVPEAIAVGNALSRPAEEYVNDPSIEAAWAMKAYENAQIHMNLLMSCDPQHLKLSDFDEEIYQKFRAKFPDFGVINISEDVMKSESGKKEWREFLESFKAKVEEYNFGTLLRLNCEGLYDSNNTTLVPKTQFLAIEIARNREACNSVLREKYRESYKTFDMTI